jgi:LysR family transcriptional regulator (chromosome initiation inhibitor)
MLPEPQLRAALASRAVVPLGGDPVRVPLYWQQWNLRSTLLDAIADEVAQEATRVLGR